MTHRPVPTPARRWKAIRIGLAATVVSTLAAGLLTSVTAAPAAAEGPCGKTLALRATPRVVINQEYETVSWWFAGGYRPSQTAVAMEHVPTRTLSDFAFSETGSGTMRIYDWEEPGRYVLYSEYGDTYEEYPDYDYCDYDVTPAYLTAKYAARSSISSARSGAYLTLRAVTQRYDGGSPLWPSHTGVSVAFQRYVNGAWQNVAWRTVPSNGVTSVRFRQPTVGSYRVFIRETGRVWSGASATIRR